MTTMPSALVTFTCATCATSRDGAHADSAPSLQTNAFIWEKENSCPPSYHPGCTTSR
jgi:hypothetical protein